MRGLVDLELIPTAYAQSGGVQKIAICNETGQTCANIMRNGLRVLAEER
jgi:hypothetical protein